MVKTIKYIKLFIIINLLSCNIDENMSKISLMMGGADVVLPLDNYYVGSIGDSNNVGESLLSSSGQPNEVYDDPNFNQILLDDSENWSGSAWRTHQSPLNTYFPFGNGFTFLHRFCERILTNNIALKTRTLQKAQGSQGIVVNGGVFSIGGAGLTALINDMNTIGETFNLIVTEIGVNDLGTPANIAQFNTDYEPWLQYLTDNLDTEKIAVIGLNPDWTVYGGTEIADAIVVMKQAVIDINTNNIGTGKPIVVYVEPESNWFDDNLDSVHYGENGTDLKAVKIYNNR